MSTGFYSRISNTIVSGNDLVSNLSGRDIRQLEFAAALSNPIITPAVVTGVTTRISAEELIQAAISTLPVNSAASGAAAGFINLGPDCSTQAQAYINLFNLSSTGHNRILRIHQTSAPDSTLSLRNNSGTHVNINVQLNGGGDADTQILFDDTVAVGTALAGKIAGLERILLVNASNLTSGSEVVNFSILSGSL
jgi:hypothetical protein